MKEKKGLSKASKRSERSESSDEDSVIQSLIPITIEIDSIENVDSLFSASDVYVIVQHHSTIIGQTDPTYILDKSYVEINTELHFSVNIALPKELDKLLTYPIYFMVWQSQNKLECENLEMEIRPADDSPNEVLSLQELVLGVKDIMPEAPPPKSMKSSQKGGKKEKTKHKESPKITAPKLSVGTDSLLEDPTCIGSGTVDLLPFFQGEVEICEVVPIYQQKLYIDDRFKHASLCPQLNVFIKIQDPLFDMHTKNMDNMFQLTVEAMYNIPEELNESYDIKLATVYPTENLILQQFYFEKGIFKSCDEAVGLMKFWPNLYTIDNLGAQTKQIIEADLSSIKNKTGIPIENVVASRPSRLVWNALKRSWLSADANEYLRQLITKFRCWPIEIKCIPSKSGIKQDKKRATEKKSGESVKDLNKKSKTSIAQNIHFHLMAYADVSTLLYPGVTKARVVCPVYNFCQTELTSRTGYEGSCFSQYTKTSNHVPDHEKDVDREWKINIKEEKASKASKDKKGKKMKEALLAQGDNCESELVRNHSGVCFIIIEAELAKPFTKRRTIEDLQNELLSIIPRRPPLPKSVIPLRLAANMFKTTIYELTREINREFQYFTQELDIQNNREVTTPCFIKYLQEKGTYQKLLMTVGQSISMLVKEKFKYTEEQQTEYMYDNYISMIYVYLINEMNKQINSIMNCNMTGCSARKFLDFNYLYLSDEAIELDIPILAEKYHLQAMKDNHRCPDHWFNLALFYKSQKFNDRAYECCKEGLALKSDHKLCLLLFGGMLYERQEYLLAETTLLAIVNHYPECLEAWVGLFIVYYHKTKYEGCDICMEHINKYKAKVSQITNDQSFSNEESNVQVSHEDSFKKYEPLSWSTQIAAKTPFFHCAVTFIKMQILQFAEQSLLFDRVEQSGEHKYYMGVVRYFRKEYTKALDILTEAQKLHGPDYAVNSMIGHCHYRLGQFEEAKEAYEFIVCAYNRPEDMHLLYTNLALIYEKQPNLELAQKYLLIVCKMSPTPYSWLLLGIVYFKEGKLKEAENCVTESNNLDNRLPETWAYLVLINIKLGKVWEAQQCFSQMMKYDLQDKSLLALVVIEMKMAKQSANNQ